MNHQRSKRVPPPPVWQPQAGWLRLQGNRGRVELFVVKLIRSNLLGWHVGMLTTMTWYGLRASTDSVYRDLTSDAWQWHHPPWGVLNVLNFRFLALCWVFHLDG